MADDKKPKTEKPKMAPKPAAAPKGENLEGMVNKTIFEKFGLGIANGFRKVLSPFYTAGWMGGGALTSYALAGPGPLISATGLGLGRYFINKKLKKPFTFKDFKREYGTGLFAGTAYSPAAFAMHGAPTLMQKLAIFFGYGAPTFMASEKFMGKLIDKYEKPSNLMKDIYNRGTVPVAKDAIAEPLREVPATFKDWVVQSKGILPLITIANWAGSHPVPLKYGISAGTQTGYRYLTSREVIDKSKNGGGNQAPAYSLKPEEQKALQQYLAQNPAAAEQLARQYGKAA